MGTGLEYYPAVLCYTNHTLLPEALEKWPLSLFATVLPRHLEIIFEINRCFLDEVRLRYPGNEAKVARLSLIDESDGKYVRMAHLACVGSQAINGVAAMHTELLKSTVLKDFFELWPEKFHNVTNGVTQRRFMVLSNPLLTALINSKIGTAWIRNLDELRRLENFSEDFAFHHAWREVKLANKKELAAIIRERTGISVDPNSLFDIQVKRLHEYKRQHLNVLHIITLYLRLKKNPGLEMTPRTFIFGGKAAPGYYMAKLIIKLINSVGDMVNRDPELKDRLKVVFFPNFNVQNAQKIYPAADLSEQISTAGKEASGTGNMKFPKWRFDHRNIRWRQCGNTRGSGAGKFFPFWPFRGGSPKSKTQGYAPYYHYQTNDHLREVIDLISSGFFSHGDKDLFRPLIESLLSSDEYLVLADYPSTSRSRTKSGSCFKTKSGGPE